MRPATPALSTPTAGRTNPAPWPSSWCSSAAFPDAYARPASTARAIAAANGTDLTRPGDPYAGRAGATPAGPGQPGTDATATPAGCVVPPLGSGPVNGTWPPEQCNVVPDPTTGLGVPDPADGHARRRDQTQPHTSIGCWDPHLWNPNSDHPKGKACGTFFGPGGQLPSTAGVARGDALVAWQIERAGEYDVNYIIWYGRTGSHEPASGAVQRRRGLRPARRLRRPLLPHSHVGFLERRAMSNNVYGEDDRLLGEMGRKQLDVQLADILRLAVRGLSWLQVRDLRLVTPVLRWEGWEEYLGTGTPNHALAGTFAEDGTWRYLVTPFAEVTAYEVRRADS